MDMNTLAKQSMTAASEITGKGFDDIETQEIAFKLTCAAMAEELANR
jgi:hypothetical protein